MNPKALHLTRPPPHPGTLSVMAPAVAKTYLAFSVISVAVELIGAQAHSQAQNDAAVREWLNTRLQGTNAAISPDDPVSIEWTVTRISLLSASDLDSRWARVERYPDHPDRSSLEYHRALAADSERVSGHLVVVDSGTWMLEENHANGYALRCGGREGVRWMLSGGVVPPQLTMIKAGVPFPATYNIGRFHEQARSLLMLMAEGWLDSLPADLVIDSIDMSAPGWRATLSSEDSGCRVIIDAAWCGAQSRILQMQQIDSVGSGRVLTTELRAEYAPDGSCASPIRVVVDRNDFIRDTYDLIAITRLSRDETLRVCSIPEPPVGARIVDFRDPRADAWRFYSDTSRLVWTNTDEQGTYASLPAVAPLHGAQTSTSSSHWLHNILSLALAFCVLASVVVIAIRRSVTSVRM